jgi:hypothetical protein
MIIKFTLLLVEIKSVSHNNFRPKRAGQPTKCHYLSLLLPCIWLCQLMDMATMEDIRRLNGRQ